MRYVAEMAASETLSGTWPRSDAMRVSAASSPASPRKSSPTSTSASTRCSTAPARRKRSSGVACAANMRSTAISKRSLYSRSLMP
jgi:hypothetical protein